MIQASLLSGGFFNALPSFVDLASLPRFGELSHNFLSHFSDAASSAFGNFRNYFDDFRLGLGQRLNIPPRFRLLNHFATAPQLFPLFNGAASGASAASAATSAAGGSSPGGMAPLGSLVGGLVGGSRLGRSASAASAATSDAGKSAPSVDDVASIAPALTIRGLEDLGGSRLGRSVSTASAAISDAAFEESAPSVDDVASIVPAPALPLAGLGGSRLGRSAVERPVRSYAENNYDESAASVAATNAAATEAKQTVTSY